MKKKTDYEALFGKKGPINGLMNKSSAAMAKANGGGGAGPPGGGSSGPGPSGGGGPGPPSGPDPAGMPDPAGNSIGSTGTGGSIGFGQNDIDFPNTQANMPTLAPGQTPEGQLAEALARQAAAQPTQTDVIVERVMDFVRNNAFALAGAAAGAITGNPALALGLNRAGHSLDSIVGNIVSGEQSTPSNTMSGLMSAGQNLAAGNTVQGLMGLVGTVGSLANSQSSQRGNNTQGGVAPSQGGVAPSRGGPQGPTSLDLSHISGVVDPRQLQRTDPELYQTANRLMAQYDEYMRGQNNGPLQ